jgi:UDPglucose--hexose-1-phosphate uridylyltransferase
MVVIPHDIKTQIPRLEGIPEERFDTDFFTIFCPKSSQWPDEVWIAPKQENGQFGNVEEAQLQDLALVLQRIIQLLDIRHGHEFPFNFYISPEEKWYLRIVPRVKRLGGFEIGTGIFVNTQDPTETMRFIKSNFENPDVERIQRENRAEYATGV